MMGHSARTTELETAYAEILIFGGVAVVIGKAMSNFFFGIQRPGVITVAAIAGNLVNLVLNYAFIFGHVGLPSLGLPGVPGIAPMGVAGAALATVLGTSIEAGLPLAIFLSRRMDQEFGIRRSWRFDRDAVRDLLRLGIPSAVQQGSEIITWAIFMSVLVGRFGDIALSAGWATLHAPFVHAGDWPWHCGHQHRGPIYGRRKAGHRCKARTDRTGDDRHLYERVRRSHVGVPWPDDRPLCKWRAHGAPRD
jgi:Na+-driven multidrug efflux pump